MRPGLYPVLFGGSRLFLDGRSDVAAAFSLRRLRRAYTGPLVRLRRSSDNAELDFGAGQRWVSYPDVLAWLAGGSGLATTFYDQSGLARNLVQASASAQPQIILADNGRPALLFDGSDDRMRTAAFALPQPRSFNVVYRRVTAASDRVIIDGLVQNEGSLDQSVVFDHRLNAGTTGPTTDLTTMPTGSRGAVGGVFNGASSRLEVSSLSLASSTSGTVGAGALTGLTIAMDGNQNASRASNAEIHEVIVFTGAHSQAQLQADNAAMRAAWGF